MLVLINIIDYIPKNIIISVFCSVIGGIIVILFSRLYRKIYPRNKQILPSTIKNALNFNHWNVWGGMKMKVIRDSSNCVVLRGKVKSSAGGIVFNHSSGLGGKVIAVNVDWGKSIFDKDRLFKFQANSKAMQPLDKTVINTVDRDYVSTLSSTFEFHLPKKVEKLEFVFWESILKEFKLRIDVRDA
jgi:hypothetical protein